VASGEPTEPAQSGTNESSESPDESGEATARLAAPSEIPDASFPVSVRGYERGAVDAFVSRVQLLVAELEASRSPEAAVKQALEQVAQQTKGILEQAGETAGQITVAARQEAEDKSVRAKQEAESVIGAAKTEAAELLAHSRADAEKTVAQARKEAAEHLQRVRAEAAAVREKAEARLRELQADTESVRNDRSNLVDDLRQLGARVAEVASAADARFPPRETAERADEEPPEAEPADEEAAEEPATEQPAVEAGNQKRSSA
jgi:cell division septum initiation protein DivIVA